MSFFNDVIHVRLRHFLARRLRLLAAPRTHTSKPVGLNYSQLTSKFSIFRTCSTGPRSGAMNITYIGPSLSPRS